MTAQKYFNMTLFLDAQEVHAIWEIVDKALARHKVRLDDGELSVRVYYEDSMEAKEVNNG